MDPEVALTLVTTASDTRYAQHEVDEDAMVKSQGTYDYLLMADPSVSARALSIVKLKRK